MKMFFDVQPKLCADDLVEDLAILHATFAVFSPLTLTLTTNFDLDEKDFRCATRTLHGHGPFWCQHFEKWTISFGTSVVPV